MNTLSGEDIKGILRNMASMMEEKKEELGALDQVIGEGDLGLTMSKGFRAVSDALAALDETDIGKVLGRAGMVMASAVPSTMGTLMATGAAAPSGPTCFLSMSNAGPCGRRCCTASTRGRRRKSHFLKT